MIFRNWKYGQLRFFILNHVLYEEETIMPTILVCDDDKQIVEAINIYLTGEGFNVIKAYDGYEALELLEKKRSEFNDRGCHDAGSRRDPHHT